MAPNDFRVGNDERWSASADSVLQVPGGPRSASLEAPDDAADVAAQKDLLVTLMPPTDAITRPKRKSGLAGRNAAPVIDAVKLIKEEWEMVTQTSVLHRLLK